MAKNKLCLLSEERLVLVKAAERVQPRLVQNGYLTMTNVRLVWVSEADSFENLSIPWVRLKEVIMARRPYGEGLLVQTTGGVEFAFKVEDEGVRTLCASAI